MNITLPCDQSLPKDESLKEIEHGSATKFDTMIVRYFLEAVGEPDLRQTGSTG